MGRRDCFGSWSPEELDVANGLIRARAEKTLCGQMCKGCGCCYHKKSLYNLYLFVIVFLIAISVVLIGIGCGIVLPYRLTKDFNETTCVVSKVVYDERRLSCGCGKGCTSSYPCLEIYVDYTRFDNTKVSTMLYENEFYGKCTYEPNCNRDFDQNAESVQDYMRKYGQGNYSCLYDPKVGSTKVIRARKLNEERMLHALIWPSIFVVIFAVVLIVMLVTCGCKYVYNCKPPQDIKDAVRAQQLALSNNDTLKTTYGY